MGKLRVADVALDPRSGGTDAIYSYRADDDMSVGDACFVDIGSRSTLGFVTSLYESSEEDLGYALRPPGQRIENLALPAQLVDLAAYAAEQYLCPLNVALTAATPPGIRDRIVTAWTLTPGARETKPAQDRLLSVSTSSDAASGHALTLVQEEVLRTMHDAGGSIAETPSKKFSPTMQKAFKLLHGKGLVKQTAQIAPFAERRKLVNLVRLTSDSAQVELFLANEGKKKPAQALTLMRLQLADAGAALTPAEIKALAGVTDSTIKALLDSGLLEKAETGVGAMAKPPKPNPFQQIAIDSIADSIQSNEHRAFLLFGVTGSGKTEVYLRAAGEALKRGRQILYLVPEIALAAQAIAQLRERFGKSVAVLHSDLSPSERLQNWMAIRSGEASVVLGARSAIFAPLDNIGLIVMDEEHEASYKQESAPRYHSKRLALYLGRKHSCPVVLGSATPSIESFQEAEAEVLTLLSLPQRAASAQLPDVYIEDLTDGFRRGQPAILCPSLHTKLEATLGRKEQAILFLNRRAYAPFIICRDCGHQIPCPRCAVSLSFHRHDHRLRCHHCGYQIVPPDTCPKCGGARITPFGIGTEKVEENVAVEFPGARVARLDRDVARRKGMLEETLAAFRSGDIDILVGTQIVAKGLDFPNVTLVGVIAADISLNLPDFRSSERTFQLLSQVAGRAGRGTSPGEVVIQTFNPEHPAVVAAQTHDYLQLFEILKEEREVAGYPPFRRLVNILLSSENRRSVLDASEEIKQRLVELAGCDATPTGGLSLRDEHRSQLEVPRYGAQLLGPVDCVMERLQSRWRRHMLIKLMPDAPLGPISRALHGFRHKGVQLVVDVDPYSLM